MAKLKLADVKFGAIYKLKVDQYAGWGYSKGDPVQIVYLQGSSIQIKDPKNPNSQQVAVQISQLDFYVQSRASIERLIDEAKATVKLNEDKIKWMDHTQNEEFDEDEFKVWSTLQLFKDPNLSDIEKAKAIAQMVKG